MASAGTELYCKICTVDAVDEKARTIDCTPIDDSAPLIGVNLQANQEGGDGIVLFPSLGSYVVVSFIEPSVAVAVLTEEIDEVNLKIGSTAAKIIDGQIDITVENTTVKITPEGVVINGGDLGGIINIKQLTEKLNELINTFNNHTHELITGAVAVTGSPSAQSNPAPIIVPAITNKYKNITVSDYEDEKVKH